MDRNYWADHIAGLDPETEYEQIYRIMVTHEFPWDMNQSLSFALYRTYAVPSIGRLLKRTGEFTERTQKRYDDTALVLDTVLEYGMTSPEGRTAIRRMNQMHGAYPISNDDKRYVLCTFVTSPIRWIDRYGWRRLTEPEKTASANYYRELGKLMGIKDIPATHQDFAAVGDQYEAEHFGFDDGGLAVSEATLKLMATFGPNRFAPRAAVTRFAKALMDDPLLDAFGYRRPAPWERALAAGALRLRGQVVRRLPPRREPLYARQLPNIRTYPDGYKVAELGTFPAPAPSPRPPPLGPLVPAQLSADPSGSMKPGVQRVRTRWKSGFTPRRFAPAASAIPTTSAASVASPSPRPSAASGDTGDTPDTSPSPSAVSLPSASAGCSSVSVVIATETDERSALSRFGGRGRPGCPPQRPQRPRQPRQPQPLRRLLRSRRGGGCG